ncbi:MAG: hypothetical protein COZ34_03360 [Candidatus Pacebacteria bacterium CG_4_10_14_3_um_filter_34_15]|nr:hypothetical protein [Candidatus Paceibacterota bacterium]OIO44243.1 MAG: hypothetical protein AUJ41_03625 [Candidatus Pacebacteria bacterium CG1_02_43_31]PIQ80757.1 MAG: hypothetical protein COV78_03620 [Candidatus Pacebacteria bacterium CG11_big_fil_rev_8_21_14_0_20_34_55]PIX81419.1 MAG: hypothetical protein COZ34_03360 [Candidatus Pacebacteria bacterium CG_4_10_14_3_um_filter_34_15]PJC43903.1 MAG: hypothetical protein CO039_01785 [Candidatus Pacebacteria bacterium CG_4_9_14_0_2_um_filter_
MTSNIKSKECVNPKHCAKYGCHIRQLILTELTYVKEPEYYMRMYGKNYPLRIIQLLNMLCEEDNDLVLRVNQAVNEYYGD